MKRRVTQILPLALLLTLPGMGFSEVPETISLPAPQMTGGMPLMEALALRRTSRTFAATPLPLDTLSSLLWAAFGINRPDEGKRTAPSARNWQEIDLYVALPEGLYLYDAQAHALQGILAKDLRARAGEPPFTATAPVVLIYVADHSRMRGSNEQSRQFYSAADTGFISQNVYLYCAANQLATVVLGMVNKDLLKDLMELRGDQHVILTQPVGAMPGTAPDANTRALHDGIYLGRAYGYIDELTVELTITGGKIAAARVVEHNENRAQKAIEAVPAALIGKRNVAGVDSITGATVTSQAILEAAQKALANATR